MKENKPVAAICHAPQVLQPECSKGGNAFLSGN
jgi:hypothetical protein